MREAARPGARLVLGVGNDWRHDDAAGLEVARRLARRGLPGVSVREQEGEPAALIESLAGAAEAIVVDAVSSGVEPGTIHRLDASAEPLPTEVFRCSTHAIGVPEAVELARALDRLPPRLVIYGVEGERFEAGQGLTPVVADAVERLVGDLGGELGG